MLKWSNFEFTFEVGGSLVAADAMFLEPWIKPLQIGFILQLGNQVFLDCFDHKRLLIRRFFFKPLLLAERKFIQPCVSLLWGFSLASFMLVPYLFVQSLFSPLWGFSLLSLFLVPTVFVQSHSPLLFRFTESFCNRVLSIIL